MKKFICWLLRRALGHFLENPPWCVCSYHRVVFFVRLNEWIQTLQLGFNGKSPCMLINVTRRREALVGTLVLRLLLHARGFPFDPSLIALHLVQ